MKKLLLLPLAALLFVACRPQPTPITDPSPTPVNEVTCGITNCHGLDITCGSDVPDVCTEEYVLGDYCRQFARCTMQEGTCQLAVDPEFEACKECVQECEGTSDPFACEETCREELPPASS